MTTKDLILKEIERLPEECLTEVLDFIRFLGSKAMEERIGLMIASEDVLKRDWLRPEEDEAWQDL